MRFAASDAGECRRYDGTCTSMHACMHIRALARLHIRINNIYIYASRFVEPAGVGTGIALRAAEEGRRLPRASSRSYRCAREVPSGVDARCCTPP